MRRALIGIFLAATMATPLAAQPVNEVSAEDELRARPPAHQRQERTERRQERTESREERRAEREARQPEPRAERPRAERRRDERTDEPVERTEPVRDRRDNITRTIDRVFGDRRSRREDHRDTHSDYRRDHDELHRRNPTDREHRRFHREVNRDHNRWHNRWDHNWRRDSRYDWQRYRYSNRGLFSIGRYSSPYRGYRYRPLSIGIRLGSGFYSHPYWINDPWRYRLPHAYAGTRWVRYYDDVVLVDLFTGEVVDVIYNFFW